ncbi:Na(+)-translocating NADH-quinone reductase subunit C [uncultured Gimesia sp.]|uniref:Na(+)-translocating NADH-quinone reductase subunit C n=1 Tax=uncultured Gimesia sp. TaxID=1678688 RepID=UPI0026146AF5|nr:Na(+)-translocating NADH-quinone reductase subunit C [uncultured Gimesia sp.]
MSRDSIGFTFLVSAALCVVCSVLVSGAAVGLRGLQEENKENERKKNILSAAGLIEPGASAADIKKIYDERVKGIIVDLNTGQVVTDDKELFPNPQEYDQKSAADNPKMSMVIPPAEDFAGIKRRETYSWVYLISNEEGKLSQYVLPIRGKGLWSTLWGFLALDTNLNTIAGLTFYEHGETPGLGGEVDNPKWKALWKGKEAFGKDFDPEIEVIKGNVVPGSKNAIHEVDGLSGATITSRGVTHLLDFWLGNLGFRPYLEQLREKGEK